MNREMLTQAIANLEALAVEMRCASYGTSQFGCWADKVLTAVSGLKEVDCQPEPGDGDTDDYEWAHKRVVDMAANAYSDARVYGVKLLKGFGYPNEVMSRAQDARALRIALQELPTPRQS